MYTEYWKLNKHPFDNVPDPAMYFDMHQSVDSAVSELLFAIEEGDDCLAVVVGPVGVGKTMCLRIVLDSLDDSKYRIAFVTNPAMTFAQLLREIIGQLQGQECEEHRMDKLLEKFNTILFETNNQGKRVLVFIDEGNVIKPANLESLRLLTNMQDDNQNLFTIIIAGQPELSRRLEDPRRANLFQRIGVYCKVEGITNRETMKDYIEHRLERAGLSGDQIFTEGAYDALWELSERGTPRLINKMCKLSMKAGETNRLKVIDGEVVKAVGRMFEKTARKLGLKKSKVAVVEEPAETPAEKAGVSEVTPPPIQLDQLPEIEAAKPDLKVLSHHDMEEMASQMATERIKDLDAPDPFEAWTKTREEILHELEANDFKKAVSQ